jgi:glutamate racemase
MFSFKKTPLLGIFDSGVGGFSVYKKIRQATSSNVVYYGDTLRAPYGNREEDEIRLFIKEDIQFLQNEGVTHFVNACNSMSVITTDILLKECSIKKEQYTDMIRAFDKHALFEPHNRVLVIATQATIRSKVYEDVIKSKGASPFSYAFSDLAFHIESNASQEELLKVIEKSIHYAVEVSATHIVYGCTHYPLVHDLFMLSKEKFGWNGDFIDPSMYVAEDIKKWNLQGERKFYPYSSKDTPTFIKHVVSLL